MRDPKSKVHLKLAIRRERQRDLKWDVSDPGYHADKKRAERLIRKWLKNLHVDPADLKDLPRRGALIRAADDYMHRWVWLCLSEQDTARMEKLYKRADEINAFRAENDLCDFRSYFSERPEAGKEPATAPQP